MKRKSVIIISILTIFLVIFEIYHVYEINYNNKQVIYSQKQDLNKNKNVLSIMVETSANSRNYKAYDKNAYFPFAEYIFNQNASKCENGGKITYNEKTNKVEVRSNISDKCYAYFDVIVMTAKDAIMYTNRTINTISDFSTPATDLNESGFFKANDNDGVSYFYRGNVENNYVKFGGYLWQIIRVNGNDTIRMMLNDVTEIPNNMGYDCSGSSSGTMDLMGHIPSRDSNCVRNGIGFTTYNEMGSGECFDHYVKAFSSDQTAYINLMSWYAFWTGNGTNQTITKHVADEPFCNDISYGMIPGVATDYPQAYIRLSMNNAPTLTCSSNNEYTVKGGYLEYPVGLITADEVVMAGGVVGRPNGNYYLKKDVAYYTLTFRGTFDFHPSAPYSPDQDYYAVATDGTLTSYRGDYYLFPVINLRADTIFAGAGTKNNPFIVL